jgi:hypothetical protein
MTTCSVTSFKNAISSVQGRFYAVFKLEQSDPKFPSGRPSLSVRTLISQQHMSGQVAIPSRPHQCLEASNNARLQPSGQHGNMSGHSSEFDKILVFKCIHPDDVVIPSGRYSESK